MCGKITAIQLLSEGEHRNNGVMVAIQTDDLAFTALIDCNRARSCAPY